MVEVRSPIIEGGGGSWSYTAEGGSTRWEATNALILKNSLIAIFFGAILRWMLARGLRDSMRRAKAAIEA